MLKVAEDTGPNTFIFISTNNISQIPATIKSRFHTTRVPRPSVPEVKEYILSKSFDLSEALTSKPVGKWIKIIMPLACLDNNDFEISAITSKAKLATVGDWMVDVHSIKYKNNQELKSCKLQSGIKLNNQSIRDLNVIICTYKWL